MDMTFGRFYLRDLKRIIDVFPHDKFDRVVQCLLAAYEENRLIFVMGNGGSGATASHFACDMNKGASLPFSTRFKVICLNDNIPTMLAYANDLSYDDVFLEQMKNFFQPEDVVMGISGSGNSDNVLKAIRYASEHGGKTIGLCGYSGGKLAKLVDIPFVIQSDDMQKIEDIHMIVVHMLMQALRAAVQDFDDVGVCKVSGIR